jgi:ABC-type lipoprotein export system ATPase subunit
MNRLFEIKKLTCSYSLNKEEKALYIENLVLEKGKLIFLLGSSGSGKSTLLETLGLMNNTIADGDIIFSPEAIDISLKQIWEEKDENRVAQIRKNYYSFIFQNTNLMENFTAYENVCLSRMIKDEVKQEDALVNARLLMEKVKLPENEVDLSTLAVNLSGGQRQRVAFVRALNTNFKVLFGDEPTGNLDESNANELFEVIKTSLNGQHSAIIVSHDINLAVKHADQIVVITKDTSKGYGEVKFENIFKRESWELKSEIEIAAFKSKIRELYKTNADHVKQSKDNETVNIKNTYQSLFLKKEGKALLGKGYLNFAILTTILFFTFLAIGFANGSLEYLHNKLDSAFVNWLNMSIPYSRSEGREIYNIEEKLKEQSNKQKFKYNNVTPYKENIFSIFNPSTLQKQAIKGRTVSIEDDGKMLREFVLSEKNLIAGNAGGFESEKDLSVIVTEKFLKENGYSNNSYFVLFNTVYGTDKLEEDTNTNQNSILPKVYLNTPIPIKAIVKDLPGKYGFINTVYFNQAFNSGGDNSFDIRTSDKLGSLKFLMDVDSIEAFRIKEEVESYLSSTKNFEKYQPLLNQVERHKMSYSKGYDFDISLTEAFADTTQASIFFKEICSIPSIAKNKEKIYRIYNYSRVNEAQFSSVSYDMISIYFTDLKNVRSFASFVLNDLNKDNENKESSSKIEVDITKVTDKENFEFLSTVTNIIAYLLVLFGTVAIALFLFNLLKMHLSKVKMNLGTFKAIGLGNDVSRNIYFLIIIVFIACSLLVSILLSSAVGMALDKLIASMLSVEKDFAYFKIYHPNTFFTIFFIFLISAIVSWATISKILSKSPGDLIYNR